MSLPDAFLALDTSAYTTSVAAIADGRVLFDGRIMLKVPFGSRGLRQSEAVFAHIKNLRTLFCDCELKKLSLKGVAFSDKPCPAEGSYMPVFCAGASHAQAISAALGVSQFPLSHQHGHIYSAFLEQPVDDGEYGVFHVSGGTLDLLRVAIKEGIVRGISPIGGKLDLTCGQLIDRVGVKAGLPFPSGAAIEQLYTKGSAPLAVHVDGLSANLSGAETQAMRRLDAGEAVDNVCSAVIDCVDQTLGKLLGHAAEQTGLCQYIFTGGVMRNAVIREHMKNMCARVGIRCIIAQKKYCSDNACGLALAAQRLFSKGDKI